MAKSVLAPAGLSVFALFVSIGGMFLALFIMMVPVAYEKYDKFTRVARAIKEVRVEFTLIGTGTTLDLLIAYVFYV